MCICPWAKLKVWRRAQSTVEQQVKDLLTLAASQKPLIQMIGHRFSLTGAFKKNNNCVRLHDIVEFA